MFWYQFGDFIDLDPDWILMQSIRIHISATYLAVLVVEVVEEGLQELVRVIDPLRVLTYNVIIIIFRENCFVRWIYEISCEEKSTTF